MSRRYKAKKGKMICYSKTERELMVETNTGVMVVMVVRVVAVRLDGTTVVGSSSQACTVMARQVLGDAGHDTV